ncbi:cystathionine gamma-synthase [Marinicella sp. S1101]|uniref:cystathionine gamma-synthase n=1 Tax=Marinicella marina TaxID=2996016 RepID=UPI002260C4DF|nr:cystathionine gamma-synthase [Marinicella marina]MCX7554597.1 cystathionine gamma-synthase [Marinicella marina]MDJ1141019.1 cystathionine gamma-synthase [Marinicella marina]
MTLLNQTTAVRAGIDCDTQYGAVTPPLYLSSNYAFEDLNQPRKYDYSRSGNPTRDILAAALAELEHAAGGVVTATGMGAVNLVLQLLPQGALVVAPHDCYGGTYRLLTTLHDKGAIKVDFVDQNDWSQIHQAIDKKPDLLWIETPSNPLLRVVDIRKLCEAAGPDVLKVVDNTFLSPALQQPITLGADLVVHSTTKYINGHSDVVGGAVLAKTEALAEQVTWWANCIGITASPFDCLLTTRGLRTLNVRMQQHLENTEKIVQFLEQHPAIKKIHYPGLTDHPGHEIAQKQQAHFGAMLSFELRGGYEEVGQLVNNLNYFTLAESLGGVESLICHPATMTHAAMAPEAQLKAGINASLIRLSVGIEAADDLIADLEYGLSRTLLKPVEEKCHVK